MTKLSGNPGGINCPGTPSRDKRVLVLAVLGGLLFLTPWLTTHQVMPTQENQYIHNGHHLYVQRFAVTHEAKPLTDAGSLKRVAPNYPLDGATATASQPVSSAALSRFFNLRFPINMATREELELLPGIGPSLACDIYTHRMQFGNFTAIHELQIISGIGKKTIQRLQPLLDFDQ